MFKIACGWMSLIIGIAIFLWLISLAGNVHVAEFFGSIIIGAVSGGGFYLTVCRGKKEGTVSNGKKDSKSQWRPPWNK